MEPKPKPPKPLIGIKRVKRKNRKSVYYVIVRGFDEKIIARRRYRSKFDAEIGEKDLRKQLISLKDGNVKFFLMVWSE